MPVASVLAQVDGEVDAAAEWVKAEEMQQAKTAGPLPHTTAGSNKQQQQEAVARADSGVAADAAAPVSEAAIPLPARVRRRSPIKGEPEAALRTQQERPTAPSVRPRFAVPWADPTDPDAIDGGAMANEKANEAAAEANSDAATDDKTGTEAQHNEDKQTEHAHEDDTGRAQRTQQPRTAAKDGTDTASAPRSSSAPVPSAAPESGESGESGISAWRVLLLLGLLGLAGERAWWVYRHKCGGGGERAGFSRIGDGRLDEHDSQFDAEAFADERINERM